MKGLKMLLLVVVAIALGILLANNGFYGSTYAQQDSFAGLKIAVVNLQVCFDKYDGAQDYKDEMNKSFEKSKGEVESLTKKLKDLQAQFQGAPDGKLKDEKFKE